MSKIATDNIKHWAKQSFKDYEPISRGFCVPLITVIITGSTMEVCNFDHFGKSTSGQFLLPSSVRELIKKLSHHCGAEKINFLLKNNITYVYNT